MIRMKKKFVSMLFEFPRCMSMSLHVYVYGGVAKMVSVLASFDASPQHPALFMHSW